MHEHHSPIHPYVQAVLQQLEATMGMALLWDKLGYNMHAQDKAAPF